MVLLQSTEMHAHQKSYDIINVVILKYLFCNFVRITVEKSTLEKNFHHGKDHYFHSFFSGGLTVLHGFRKALEVKIRACILTVYIAYKR